MLRYKSFLSQVLISCLLFLTPIIYAQQLTEVIILNSEIKETSGLIYLNQKLITHTDSGGEAALYEIDTITGNISRKVVISNATNIDWEDICFDDTYIYIGDFGNNTGSRTDLKIYRISISDYNTTANNTVEAEVINFSYLDQTDFTPALNATNFDAEALISYDDKLYIFTKNWKDLRSNIYAVSKTPGTYQISKIDNINSQGLITGATYNTSTTTVVLSGYLFSAFIIEIYLFNEDQFSSGTMDRYTIEPIGSFQIESITPLNDKQYYLTSEENTSGSSKLYRLNSKNYLSITESNQKLDNVIFPNPATDIVTIRNDHLISVEFYDSLGALRKTANKNQIDISDLAKGVYIIKIRDGDSVKYLRFIKQ